MSAAQERAPSRVDVLRQPPHSIESEQSVLGGLLLVPEALSKLSDWLTAEDFYRREHRLIFQAICALAEKGKPIDSVTLADWFAANGNIVEVGGPAYLAELANTTPSAANITAYAEIVAEKSRLRQVIERGTQLVGNAFAGKTASQDLVAGAMYEFSQLQPAGAHAGLLPIKDGLRALYAQMSDRYAAGPGLIGLPTPWHDLNAWSGGMCDSEFIVVGARPSMCKSVFGLQFAVMNALRGVRGAFFSVEMTAKQCMARAVSAIADIDYKWVKQPDPKDPDSDLKWQAISLAHEALLKSPMLIDDTPAISIKQLMARARRAHLQAPLRWIVVDHAHDMKIDPKLARFEYGEIAQGCKTLAKEFACPVILISQLNREVTKRNNKRPNLADLRESGDFEQKADVIYFLHREDYYDPRNLPGVVEVICAKGRDLPPQQPIHLRNRSDRMRLEDWTGPMPSARHEVEEGFRV